jgi:hypothetical protein
MTPAQIILERLRPYFEERAAVWGRLNNFPEPEEITLSASFPVAALREALAPPALRPVDQLYADVDHHLVQILDLLKPGEKR